MAKIKWSNLAEADLKGIFDFISLDSKVYASRQIDKIVNRVTILEDQPHIGRVVPEFNITNIRELIEGNYRIVYRIESEKEISIVRIHHSSRLLKGL